MQFVYKVAIYRRSAYFRQPDQFRTKMFYFCDPLRVNSKQRTRSFAYVGRVLRALEVLRNILQSGIFLPVERRPN